MQNVHRASRINSRTVNTCSCTGRGSMSPSATPKHAADKPALKHCWAWWDPVACVKAVPAQQVSAHVLHWYLCSPVPCTADIKVWQCWHHWSSSEEPSGCVQCQTWNFCLFFFFPSFQKKREMTFTDTDQLQPVVDTHFSLLCWQLL